LEGAIDLSEDRLRAVVGLALLIPLNEGKIAGLSVPGQIPTNSTILIPTNSTILTQTNSTILIHTNSTILIHTNSTILIPTNSTILTQTNSTILIHTNSTILIPVVSRACLKNTLLYFRDFSAVPWRG
jgi:hypothetical protein